MQQYTMIYNSSEFALLLTSIAAVSQVRSSNFDYTFPHQVTLSNIFPTSSITLSNITESPRHRPDATGNATDDAAHTFRQATGDAPNAFRHAADRIPQEFRAPLARRILHHRRILRIFASAGGDRHRVSFFQTWRKFSELRFFKLTLSSSCREERGK
jgi:hypothetical protein